MATIRLYKRSECKAKVSVKVAAETLAKQDVRVLRPSLLDFMVGGGFAKLPVTPTALIDSPYKRPTNQGYEIPLDSRGRKAYGLNQLIYDEMVQEFVDKTKRQPNKNQREQMEREALKRAHEETTDGSTKESIRIWIEKNLEQFGISRDAVSVVIDND